MARILFIQNFWFEYLGTMVLSAVLKNAGHQVDLVIDNNDEKILQYAEFFKPDIAAMYVSSGSHVKSLETLKKVKNGTGALTVIGGPHPTYFPESINHLGVDALCIGEGDDAMLELADIVGRGGDLTGIKNIWVKSNRKVHRNPLRPLITNLDNLPIPDRSLYYKYSVLRNSPSKHFITGRGCPFECSFCCNKAYKQIYSGKGPMVRRANPEKVCKEILDIKENYPLRSVRFDDEVFLLDTDWSISFLKDYKKWIDLPFSCLIRADITTAEVIHALKDAGCYIAYFGVESGDDFIRNRVLQKKVDREQIKNTAWLLKKSGIKIGTFNMVGMPGETFEDAWETVRLNQIIQSDYPWCSIIQPYPGTELERFAKAEGYLDTGYGAEDLTQSYFNNTVIENPDSDQLVALQKLFYIAVKLPALSPLIKKLIERYGYSEWMKWAFNLTYAYRYSKTYKMPIWEVLRRALLWKDNY